jgi:hypothetical protein
MVERLDGEWGSAHHATRAPTLGVEATGHQAASSPVSAFKKLGPRDGEGHSRPPALSRHQRVDAGVVEARRGTGALCDRGTEVDPPTWVGLAQVH